MGNVTLWQKLSGNINYFLQRDFDIDKTNEENFEEYKMLSFVDDEKGNIIYIDKQTRKWIILDSSTLERIENAFMERIERKRKRVLSD